MNRIKIKNFAVLVMFFGLFAIMLQFVHISVWGITLVEGQSYIFGVIIWMLYHFSHDKLFRSRDKSVLQTILILSFPMVFSILFVQVAGANFSLDYDSNRSFDYLLVGHIVFYALITFQFTVIYFRSDTLKVKETILVIIIYACAVYARHNEYIYDFRNILLMEVISATAAGLQLFYFYQFDKMMSINQSTPH